MTDKKKDAENLDKVSKRRNNKAASKGGKDADADTRKALGNFRKLIKGD